MTDARAGGPGAQTRGYNFLGLAPEDAEYEKARVVIVPVAYEATTSYKAGTKYGPAAIIAASREVESYDRETGRDLLDLGIATGIEVESAAEGPAAMVDVVEREIARHLTAGKFCVMLGGEHSITTGAVRAHHKLYPDLSVLQIDAHADMRDSYQGSKHSHACTMRRVREICPAVSVGIRSVSEECHERIEKDFLPVFWADECAGGGDWCDAAIDHLSDDVYITFDCDGLDPSIMPSVGTPEPGGLLWQGTVGFLRKVFAAKNVVGFDVVELCPMPPHHASDFLAARLVAAMIGMAFPPNR
jgi:agmatinase